MKNVLVVEKYIMRGEEETFMVFIIAVFIAGIK